MSHTTYHDNGYMHHKWGAGTPNPENQPRYYGPPIEEFRGFVTTDVTMLSNDLKKSLSPDFEGDNRSYDHITYIDTSDLEFGVKYQCFICEPGYPISGLVYQTQEDRPVNDGIDNTLNYHVYTGVKPWIGIAYWPQKSTIHGLGATRNFRSMGISMAVEAHDNPNAEPCQNGEKGCDGTDGSGPLCRDCYREIDRT